MLSVGHEVNRELVKEEIKRRCNKSPGVLDISSSPPKKSNIVCSGVFPYERITTKG